MLDFIYDFRFRIFLLISVVVLPLLILTLVFGFTQRKYARAQALDNSRSFVNVLLDEQEDSIVETRSLIKLLSQVPEIVGPNKNLCQNFLSRLIAENPQYLNLGTVNLKGDIDCSALSTLQGINVSDRLYIQKAFAKGDFSISDYQISRTTGKPSLNFAYPITDNRGDISGLFVAVSDLKWISERAGLSNLPANSSVTIVDRNAVVLARYPDHEIWVGREIGEEILAQKIIMSESGDFFELAGIDGVERLYLVNKISATEENSGYLAVGVPKEKIYGQINDMVLRIFAGMILFLMLGFVFVWFYGRRSIILPIEALIAAAERYRNGDLEARVSIFHKKGELGELSQTFNNMAESLQRQIIKIEQAKIVLENELRHKTELEKKERDFVSMASHDLQTPLALVRGYISMLASGKWGKMDKTINQYLSAALSGVDRMNKLIRDLLMTSRIEAGKMLFEKTAFDVDEEIRTVCTKLASIAAGHGLKFSFGPRRRLFVLADRDRFSEVVTNLVDNAIKYTEKGGIVVKVSKAGGFAHVSVSDTGIGIRKAVLPHVFDKFYFSENFVSKERESTGLGLYIAKSLISAMGGTIDVESEIGKGSKFTLTLPLADARGKPLKTGQ